MEQKANIFNNPRGIIKDKDARGHNLKDHTNGWDCRFTLPNFSMDLKLKVPILYRHWHTLTPIDGEWASQQNTQAPNPAPM